MKAVATVVHLVEIVVDNESGCGVVTGHSASSWPSLSSLSGLTSFWCVPWPESGMKKVGTRKQFKEVAMSADA